MRALLCALAALCLLPAVQGFPLPGGPVPIPEPGGEDGSDEQELPGSWKDVAEAAGMVQDEAEKKQQDAKDELERQQGEVQRLRNETVNSTHEELQEAVFYALNPSSCQTAFRVENAYMGHVIESRRGTFHAVETEAVRVLLLQFSSTVQALLGTLMGQIPPGVPFDPASPVGEATRTVTERLTELDVSAEWQEDYVLWNAAGPMWIHDDSAAPYWETEGAVREQVCGEDRVVHDASEFDYFAVGAQPEDGWRLRTSTVNVVPAGPATNETGPPPIDQPQTPEGVAQEIQERKRAVILYEMDSDGYPEHPNRPLPMGDVWIPEPAVPDLAAQPVADPGPQPDVVPPPQEAPPAPPVSSPPAVVERKPEPEGPGRVTQGISADPSAAPRAHNAAAVSGLAAVALIGLMLSRRAKG